MKVKLIWLALTGSLMVSYASAQKAPLNNKAERPNVVLIFADDMGYGDLGSYGTLAYSTPNLDKLAAEGRRFTNFNVAHAICSASRAALLTGCYANRVSIEGALSPLATVGLNPEEETIAEILKKRGYATAIFGKWHLGHHQKFLPLQQGFDEYVGLPYSNDMWHLNYDGTKATPETNARKASFPPLPLIRGNEKFREINTLEDQAELTTIYTEQAVGFIQKNKSKPFFLYMPHSMPHVPLAVSSKFKGKSKQGLYGDVLMEIDWSVGQVLQALEQNGLTKNTLVIFTSDNGPWFNFGNHAGSTGGLREGKATTWEGGHRVPAIMKWPGHIPPGTVCNELAATIDILPTLAAISGAALPQKKIDGVNIVSLLTGQPQANPRKAFYYYGNGLEGVRQEQWKLMLPHTYRTYEGFMPGHNGVPGKTGEQKTDFALYDLRRDPGERYDVKEMYPDIVTELKALADVARKDLGDEILKITGENVREPGKL
ncbi:arylsulfatase [Adhaeribacter aerolatus]|uniref:Arylsulfatase n=1 Tax=Adhaeribacter aerolatus TaxID=670289 RepID=A0A512B3B3_9BACT|nr:sulfatase [Adhaeribacter aerolatus]GEO06453.1 arylsulfatase [Adhaeribacter aerolatus]